MKISQSYKTLIIGCGIRQVKQFKEKCVAIDISREYLDKAKEVRPKNIYVKASVEKMPFQKNTFKKIVFTHVLEHLDHPEKALSEIYRTLEPGGELFLVVPSKHFEDFLSKHNPIVQRDIVKKFHKTHYTEENLKKALHRFDIKIKVIKGKDIAFWWLWGKFITALKLENKFYIEECGQIHSKKYDWLARQFSRCLYVINRIITFAFKNITSEYEVIAIKGS